MDKAQGVESARWYLVQSKPRQAQRAEINLMRQGYVVYHPKKSSYTLPHVTQAAEISAQGGPHEQPDRSPAG